MAVTPNYGLFVYGAEDTSVRFLDFRVNIAGTQSTSNFYVIDTKMKEMSDKIQILENSPSAYSINATYSSENYYIASSLDFPGYEANQLISLSLDRNNIGTVTININSSSTVSVMKYNNSGELVNMDDNDFTINNPILCIYDGTRFVAIGVKNANNINISGNNGEIVIVSPENKLASSGKKIGEANGVASLDSSGNVQQPANSTVNSLTISLNGDAQTPFNGSNPVSFNITPESISAATSEQGQNADSLVSGDIPAGKATVLAIPRKIGNAEFDGSKDITGSEIGIPNPNLLDNSDFLNPVNQRGSTSYSFDHQKTSGYTIDRWKVELTVPMNSGSLNIGSNGITLQGINGGMDSDPPIYLAQIVNCKKINQVYTLSVNIDDEIFTVTGVPSEYSSPSQDGLSIAVSGVNIYIKIARTGTFKWVKLEEGSVATPWQPKDYGVELMECQRYYLKVISWQLLGTGYVNYDGTFFVIMMPTPSTMRIGPTISNITGTVYFEDGTTKVYTGTPTAVTRPGWLAITFKGTFTGHGGKPVNFITNETATEISADL